MREIVFYFDFISNNAYLAWTQLDRLTKGHDINIKPVPVLFAGLLNAHKSVGPAEIPAKRNWMLKNILRKATLLGVPMAPPAHHPFNPLPALRACTAPMSDAQRALLIDALFKAIWVDSVHISELTELEKIITRVGLDKDIMSEWINSTEASDMLRSNTQEAVDAGTFGIPTLMIEDQLFFGYDDFEYLALYLQGLDPVKPSQLEGWNTRVIPPSSIRSR